jgi:hypothetical protein
LVESTAAHPPKATLHRRRRVDRALRWLIE